MNTPVVLPEGFPDIAEATQVKLLELRWQDNRSGRWSKLKQISLGAQGDGAITRRLSPMGHYRSRQFEFTLTDAIFCTISSVEDDNGVLA